MWNKHAMVKFKKNTKRGNKVMDGFRESYETMVRVKINQHGLQKFEQAFKKVNLSNLLKQGYIVCKGSMLAEVIDELEERMEQQAVNLKTIEGFTECGIYVRPQPAKIKEKEQLRAVIDFIQTIYNLENNVQESEVIFHITWGEEV